MKTTIQVRHVPEEVSRTLKARAAQEGRSLSDYLLGELTRIARRPTRREALERIRMRGSADLTPAAEELRLAREERA